MPTPYRSHADLGGQLGHGPVRPEPEGEHFHASWEPRALAVTLAMGATGAWNIDMSRAAREQLTDYAQLSYYEIWWRALEVLLAERRLVDADEIAAGRMLGAGPALPRRLQAGDVPSVLAKGSPTQRPPTGTPRFQVGQPVRTRAAPADHHTRLPAYARGRQGVVQRVHGCHVFADTHAQGLGEQPQWLYTVAFDGTSLWGGEPTARGVSVSVDAWESYLEAVP